MTSEGRLARGKRYYEAGKFLDNIQVKEYLASIAKPEKPKETKKDAKPRQ